MRSARACAETGESVYQTNLSALSSNTHKQMEQGDLPERVYLQGGRGMFSPV